MTKRNAKKIRVTRAFSTSLLFLFVLLFLREYGQVEDSPHREQAGGSKGEEDIAINVVVNLKEQMNKLNAKDMSTSSGTGKPLLESKRPTTEKTSAFCQAEMVLVQSCIGEDEGKVLGKVREKNFPMIIRRKGT